MTYRRTSPVEVLILLMATAVIIVGSLWFITTRAGDISLGATVRWNCSNLHTSQHPAPIDFFYTDGMWTVTLADHTTMYGQMLGDSGIQKWTLEDATWWTDGFNVVYCNNNAGVTPVAGSDVQAISVLMSMEHE
jgi:hypothetical protein